MEERKDFTKAKEEDRRKLSKEKSFSKVKLPVEAFLIKAKAEKVQPDCFRILKEQGLIGKLTCAKKAFPKEVLQAIGKPESPGWLLTFNQIAKNETFATN